MVDHENVGKSLKAIGDEFLDKQHNCQDLKQKWFLVMVSAWF
jgi:hypothetical protein